jgi:hypothetical protein
MGTAATWPHDADGDVFRRLEANGFDFTAEYEIDFNVDFEEWPPKPDAIAWLQSHYSDVEVYEPEEDFNGSVQFKIRSKVNYTLVVDTQTKVSEEMRQYGGVCESWGVAQPAE